MKLTDIPLLLRVNPYWLTDKLKFNFIFLSSKQLHLIYTSRVSHTEHAFLSLKFYLYCRQ